MIEIKHVSKSFEDIKAVDDVSLTIREGAVLGLIGTNGAGKSTLLRMICGVLKPDAGEILIDGMPVYDNVAAKKQLFFIADEPYFFPNATPHDMERYYSSVYENFRIEDYYMYLERFGLGKRRKINTFSKGMKKQLALLCGICAGTKYVFCDETFDGLDPVIREGVKQIFAKEKAEHGMTPVIASHNLRELEDMCEYVGLLHKGGVLLSKDLHEMQTGISKVQCILQNPADERSIRERLQVMKINRRGSVITFTVRGSRKETAMVFGSVDTVFCELLPLTLEEMFISETEVVGYDMQKLILS